MWNRDYYPPPYPSQYPETRVIYLPTPPRKRSGGSKKRGDKETLAEKLAEIRAAKQELEDLEKLLKKEEKKDEKKPGDKKEGFSRLEIFILATIASPLVFLCQAYMVKEIVGYITLMAKTVQ